MHGKLQKTIKKEIDFVHVFSRGNYISIGLENRKFQAVLYYMVSSQSYSRLFCNLLLDNSYSYTYKIFRGHILKIKSHLREVAVYQVSCKDYNQKHVGQAQKSI